MVSLYLYRSLKKVSSDLLKYGNVQRGYIGILPIELNSTIAKEKNLKVGRGIYVENVVEKGAAEAAGLKKGDVIVKMEGQPLGFGCSNARNHWSSSAG